MAIDLDKARATLLARREELRQLSDMTSDARQTVRVDQQSVGRLSRIDSLQQQAMAQATERQRAAELTRIEAALERIEAGEYGICQECGEEIGEKRLEIDPSAGLCIACAKASK